MFQRSFFRRRNLGGVVILLTLLTTACAGQPMTSPQGTLIPTPPVAAPAPSLDKNSPSSPPAVLQPSPAPGSGGTSPLPTMYDGHLHYSDGVWSRYSVQDVVAILDRAGISRALISSTPNEGSLRLYQTDKNRFILELRPYRTISDRESWFRNAEIVSFLKEELKRGVYSGIGEFHLNGNDARTPIVKQMVDLAVRENLPLHAHSDELAIEGLFAVNPQARVMWAHTGMSTPPETVAKMLERYPNLWAELSYRSDIVENGKLSAAWRELFLRFPDRFVYGSDTWIESRWEGLPELVGTARGWLAELPAEVAANIAYKNLQALYAR